MLYASAEVRNAPAQDPAYRPAHPPLYGRPREPGRAAWDDNLLTATYFQARSITQTFEVDGLQSPVPDATWLRPLEFCTTLHEAGFAITSLTEPHPSEQPLFMLMAAQRWPR